jgi:hypothetical protein
VPPDRWISIAVRAAKTERIRPVVTLASAASPRKPWWKWFDFDSELLAQVWFICSTQIVIFVVGGLVIHASAASPY